MHGCAAVTKSVTLSADAWQGVWLPAQHAGGVSGDKPSMLLWYQGFCAELPCSAVKLCLDCMPVQSRVDWRASNALVHGCAADLCM